MTGAGLIKNHALDQGAPWLHLANTSKRPELGGDAVSCQITLTMCEHSDVRQLRPQMLVELS